MITQWSKSYEEFVDVILTEFSSHHISSAVCLLSDLTQLDEKDPDILDIFLRIDASRNKSIICGHLPDDLWCRLYHSDTTFRTVSQIDMIAGKFINAGYFAFVGSLDKSAIFPFYQTLAGGDAKIAFEMLHNQASRLIAGDLSEQSTDPGNPQVTS